jgi:hypothetical protein
MFNNPAIHPRTGDFVKNRLDLLSDYLCIHAENEQLPAILCFRNLGPNSLRISSTNPKANFRKFSYTKNNRLNPIIFRKGSYPISYKKNSLIRDSFVNSVWLASPTQQSLKEIEAKTKILNVGFKSKGVKS